MRATLAAILALFAGCDTNAGNGPHRVVSGAEAKKLAEAGSRVVDVRTPQEFAQGHVPGAINIPFDQVGARVAEIGDPAKPVVLYCRSGRRSAIAARTLIDLGFTQIADMQKVNSWPGKLQTATAR